MKRIRIMAPVVMVLTMMLLMMDCLNGFTSPRVFSSVRQQLGGGLTDIRREGREERKLVSPSTQQQKEQHSLSRTSPCYFNDGGLLGVGAPEVVTIVLVGYFILGPSELYKVTKEVGKFIQNIRVAGSQASESLQNSMENQLQLEEIRKAQRELNDAFSFRRSINVDETAPAFTNAPAAQMDESSPLLSESSSTEDEPKIRKRIRRRKRKVITTPEEEEETVPDLTMPVQEEQEEEETIEEEDEDEEEDELPFMDSDDDVARAEEQARLEEVAELRRQRMERLEKGMASSEKGNDWFSDMPPAFDNSPVAAADGHDIMNQQQDAAAQARFAAQMNGNWNESILDKQEELSPLATVMEKLALLEEEKQAADSRLQQEFEQRRELEENFYKEKRQLLEQAAQQVQINAMTTTTTVPVSSNSTETTSTTKTDNKQQQQQQQSQ